MGRREEEFTECAAALERMQALPALLATLREMIGMGVCVVAGKLEGSWIALAVDDAIGFGVKAGDALPSEQVDEQGALSAPGAVGARGGLRARIALADGTLFGYLCVFDSEARDVADPRALAMLARFAGLVGAHLDADRLAQTARSDLANERAAAVLRDEFTAILGHDLRNPLAAIVAWARVLRAAGADPKRVAKACSRIEASASRMGLLIENTLDHARERLGGGLSASIEPVDDLALALDGVVDELARAHPDREVRGAVDIPRTVRCDRGRAQQLASNLLANAIAHGRPAGPVSLDARLDGGVLAIRVWNSGNPIPPNEMRMVFKPFWRAAAPGERQGGLGLGLHICDLIAKAHGGALSVESTVEDGTTFTALLPVGG